jgi:hypothetical protein
VDPSLKGFALKESGVIHWLAPNRIGEVPRGKIYIGRRIMDRRRAGEVEIQRRAAGPTAKDDRRAAGWSDGGTYSAGLRGLGQHQGRIPVPV